METLPKGDWDKPTPLKSIEDYDGATYQAICIFGDWNVTIDGDIINTKYWYPIWSHQLSSNSSSNWILHLSGKKWFDEQSYEDFKRAFFIAYKILGRKQPKQIHDYSELKN